MTFRMAMAMGGLIAAAAVCPAMTDEASATAGVEPEAEQALRAFADTLRAADRLRLDIASAVEMKGDGMRQKFETTYTVAMERPNKAAIRLEKGMMGGTMISDGERIVTYMPMIERYKIDDAPASFEEMRENDSLGMSSGIPLLDAILSDRPFDLLMDGVLVGRVVGEEEIDGAPCTRLYFEQEDIDWEVWIRREDPRLVVQLVPDMSRMFEAMGESGPPVKDMEIDMVVSMNNWRLDEPLPEDAFDFEPPEGAEEVDNFFEGMGPGGSEEPENPLLGMPAPRLQLDLLDGGALDTDALRGDHIVILDFWATWCGPCRAAMPILEEVAQEFRDRGVRLFAVNQRESEDAIRAYLEEEDLDVTVALDPAGEAASLYGVQGIPQTVIIDRRGDVAQVHVGLLPGLKETLRRELKELLESPDEPAAE